MILCSVFRCVCEKKVLHVAILSLREIEKDGQTMMSLRASLKAASLISAIIFDGCPDPSLLLMLPVSLYLVIPTWLAFRFSWHRSRLIVTALCPLW